MEKADELGKRRSLECIAHKALIISYVAQLPSPLYSRMPSGLEQLLDTFPADITGILLTLSGAALAWHSQEKIFSESGLVTEGTHGVIRHPIYAGFRLASVGWMLTHPSLVNLVLGAAVFLTSELTARLEERKLEQLYGDEFLAYKDRVPMWIPYANRIREVLTDWKDELARVFKTPTPY